MPFDNEPFDAGVEADLETDPTKYIQQLSGKLGQSIRDYTEKQGQADLELEKFAINSVVSATHTTDMSPEDRNDIINKINKAGGDKKSDNDDFGDTTNGGPDQTPEDGEQEEESTDENVIHEIDGNSNCLTYEMQMGILPKEHKQVFINAKLGVDEVENKKMDDSLVVDENLSIFAENNIKKTIMQRITQIVENDAPTKEPKTIPVVKPDEQPQPTRRQKPWRIDPNPNPEPKADK